MKIPKPKIFTLITVLVATSIPQAGQAQRLYNKERDDQAQAALPLAQSLKSGELFDKQLKNFASLVKKDFETEFLVTRFQINAFTLGVLTWGSANTRVCDIEERNSARGLLPTPEEIKAALDQLQTSIDEAKKSMEAFKKSIKTKDEQTDEQEEKEDRSVLATLFNTLGELDSLQDFLEQVRKAKPEAVDKKTLQSLQQVQDVAAQLKTVYDAYTAKVKDFNTRAGKLAELRLVLKTVAIQSLQVDEDHWKNIAAIRARREIERAEALGLIKQYKGTAKRLTVVDFPSVDPAKKELGFCDIAKNAVKTADGFDLWPQQMITAHLQELVTLGESMEKNNKAIEDEAQIALKKIGEASSEQDRRAASEQTLTALKSAWKKIDEADQIHEFQKKISDELKADGEKLKAAITNSHQATVVALHSIIIARRQNSVQIRDMVADIPQMLFIVAALIARGSTATRLADLRMAQELHAYSIRKSAVRARAYELTVSTGVQRLALFHQGGIKPTDVAELVFAASNIAITPAILAR